MFWPWGANTIHGYTNGHFIPLVFGVSFEIQNLKNMCWILRAFTMFIHDHKIYIQTVVHIYIETAMHKAFA